MVVVLAVGIAFPRAAPAAAGTVGVIYAVATGLEAFHGTELVGVVPVDMRDRVVHPLLAGLAFSACCWDNAAAPTRSRRIADRLAGGAWRTRQRHERCRDEHAAGEF
jgi:hypothetical protein